MNIFASPLCKFSAILNLKGEFEIFVFAEYSFMQKLAYLNKKNALNQINFSILNRIFVFAIMKCKFIHLLRFIASTFV